MKLGSEIRRKQTALETFCHAKLCQFFISSLLWDIARQAREELVAGQAIEMDLLHFSSAKLLGCGDGVSECRSLPGVGRGLLASKDIQQRCLAASRRTSAWALSTVPQPRGVS